MGGNRHIYGNIYNNYNLEHIVQKFQEAKVHTHSRDIIVTSCLSGAVGDWLMSAVITHTNTHTHKICIVFLHVSGVYIAFMLYAFNFDKYVFVENVRALRACAG